MREIGIKAHYIRPCTITTKDCDFSSKLKNILKRNFNPEKPNSAWCTDITLSLIHIFLCNVLGVDAEVADEEACHIEHVISEDTFQKIANFKK